MQLDKKTIQELYINKIMSVPDIAKLYDVKVHNIYKLMDKLGIKRRSFSDSQTPLVKEKIKQTSRKRYGTDCPLQSESIKNKTKQTNLKKYGVENVLQSEKIKEKIKQTNLKRYGAENPWQ